MSMAAALADLLAVHRIRPHTGRWVCSCGRKTYGGGTRAGWQELHEVHVAESLIAAGCTPPRADPRDALRARAQQAGIEGRTTTT